MVLRNEWSWLDKASKKTKKDFIKANKNGGTFRTVNGEINTIEKIDGIDVYIKCKTKDSSYKIPRKDLSDAVNQLYFRKSLKRSDLSRNSRYNSALFGILIEMFKDKITVEKDKEDKRSWRILLKGVRFVPSGMGRAGAKDWLSMKKSGIKVVMLSYGHTLQKDDPDNVKPESFTWYLWCVALDMYAIIDSGAFTIAKNKNCKVSIYRYAEYIKRFKSRILDYINLDVIGDAIASRKNFELLYKLTGIKPIPVWHPSKDWENSNWEELDNLVNANDIVAIGGTHQKFFGDKNGSKKRALFKRINEKYPYNQFHYMGGSSKLILEDIWQYGQADSTGWVQPRSNGRIYSFRKGDIATEKLPKKVSKLEGILYTLQNLSGFERDYGNFRVPNDILTWLNNNKKAKDDILLVEDKFKKLINELRKKVKKNILIDITKNDPIGDQIMFNLDF